MFHSIQKFIYRNYRLRPVLTHLAGLLIELIIGLRDRLGRVRSRRFARQAGLKLNLGCGSNRREGWLNIDIDGGCDLRLDLRKPLPFPGESCEIVYAEHLLEHLDYPYPALRLLRSIRRCLKPGGRIHIGVPDAGQLLRDFGREGSFERIIAERSDEWHPEWCETAMEYINLFFRCQNDHRYAYDQETLIKLLRRAGFVEIHRREYDPDLDSENRRRETLYVTACKRKAGCPREKETETQELAVPLESSP